MVRTALQDAASVASLLITTEAVVAELPKKETAAPAAPGTGMNFQGAFAREPEEPNGLSGPINPLNRFPPGRWLAEGEPFAHLAATLRIINWRERCVLLQHIEAH